MIFLRKLLFSIKSGIVGVWKNKSMGFASIISIAAVSVILGIVLISALSMNVILKDVQSKVDEIEVYVKDDLSDEDCKNIGEELKALDGVVDIRFKSKEDALHEMKKVWGEDAYILEGLEQDNPLERSYVISVDTIESSHSIYEKAKAFNGVSNVIYYQDAVDKLVKIADYVRVGGLVITVVLIIISILVISNTVKLTVLARKREIEVMKYVGASNSMISLPFMIEGIIFGLMGALLAYLLTFYTYKIVYNNFNEKIYSIISSNMISPNFLKFDILVIYAMLGIVIGTVGSVFSLKKYLRV